MSCRLARWSGLGIPGDGRQDLKELADCVGKERRRSGLACFNATRSR